MPVTFDNIGFSQSSGAALQFTFTAAANSSLLVFTASDLGKSASAIAYNGVALSKLGRVDKTECWGLLNPAAGANVLSAQFVGGVLNWEMIAITYLNVASFGGIGSATSSLTTVNLSVSSTSTNVVVGCYATTNGNNIDFHNGTVRLSAAFATVLNMGIVEIAGAATVSLSASASGALWNALGVNLNFSAVSTATPFTRSLMGIGK